MMRAVFFLFTVFDEYVETISKTVRFLVWSFVLTRNMLNYRGLMPPARKANDYNVAILGSSSG